MNLQRWGLSETDVPQFVRLASEYHQDFDLERTSFRAALDRRAAWLTLEDRERLADDVALCLERARSSDEFSRLFVAAGAENWPTEDDPRSELVDWLSRQA